MTQCWCGNTNLSVFSSFYLKCSACKTLVLANMPDVKDLEAMRDQQDFYGRRYYETHLVERYHYPSLSARARADLPERCLHWLHAALKYKLPPSRILELGSAHGGFVALLRWAGFEATGLDLSPWVVEFAKETFHVPMLLGPVEAQDINPGALDVIALLDVLEHFSDPVTTMRHCLNLLKQNGILLIQTPLFPENKSYEQMKEEDDSFLLQLKEDEHLYLFSEDSIKKFFHKLGTKFLEFEPAIFSHYDMFLVVCRKPLNKYTPDLIESALVSTPGGRLIQAMFDLHKKFNDLNKKYQVAEADRAARLDLINELTEKLAALQSILSWRIIKPIRWIYSRVIEKIRKLPHNSVVR